MATFDGRLSVFLETDFHGSTMRVITLFLRYGTEDYPDAERQMDEIFARNMPNVQRKTLIIDNALPRHIVQPAGQGKILIGGDNTFWEFSAWDRAIEHLGNEIWTYDLVHLATSAFYTLYVKYLDRFDERMLRAVSQRPVCLGHVDCLNEPIGILSFKSQHWIRSCFFFLPPAEVKALRSFVSIRDKQRIFAGTAAQPFRENAPVSENYRRYIQEWLGGGDIGQGVAWHSGFELTPERLSYFEDKALTILNEHLLSIRLRAMQCRSIDVTWLATQQALRPNEEVAWNLSWREQLAARDVDALLPLAATQG
jgi:hypothetical protein